MFFEPKSRRYFLRTMAGALVLPYLPSMMPKAHAAEGIAPKRFIQVATAFGVMGERFFPGITPTLQGSTGVHAARLSAVDTGPNNDKDMSWILGNGFNSVKNKISLVRGINVLAGSEVHNGSMPTCASGTPEDNVGNGRPVFPWSIDTVLAQSNKVYPDATGKQRQVVFSPVNAAWNNFSWWKRNDQKEHYPSTFDTASLLAKFTQLESTNNPSDLIPSSGTPMPPTLDARRIRERDILHDVYEDYASLKNKLSKDDGNRLNQYMQMMSEVQAGLREEGPTQSVATCRKAYVAGSESEAIRHENQLRIVIAAMACDLTRVAAYSISMSYDPMHAWAHGMNVTDHSNMQRELAKKVSFLCREMDKIPDANGKTLLDNSIVYYANEFGELQSNAQHNPFNHVALIAGGADGALEMGWYINYRMSHNRPMNNLLITMMNAMGLSSADYQRDGVVGFGEYNASRANQYGLSNYLNASERLKPLPFLYKGSTLG